MVQREESPKKTPFNSRVKSAFDERMTTERAILRVSLNDNDTLPTEVRQLGEPHRPNPVSEERLGTYRRPDARKLVTADEEVIKELLEKSAAIPSFLEAGPRQMLYHDPQSVRAAVVTSGGLAPGLNCVVHSIVDRHWNTYANNEARGGGVFGVRESFMGLSTKPANTERLDPRITEEWLDAGGSMLGSRRFFDLERQDLCNRISENLELNGIDILYVIGGDGSLSIAHQVAGLAKKVSVVGVPKTMDNDILWVWQSFGFDTAVEKATEIINTMHTEAQSTRRVCIIELFGAESGFVAANAALASGHVDLVLIPEPFEMLNPEQVEHAISKLLTYLARTVGDKRIAHGIVVIAEGVAELLEQRNVRLGDEPITSKDFVSQLSAFLQGRITDRTGRSMGVFVNQPRHNIRAIPANAHDRIYCERLGALAVDNALAGYTDFVISQWLTEYVLVPLQLVTPRQKSIPPSGIFWKQVVSSTGQPFVAARRPIEQFR